MEAWLPVIFTGISLKISLNISYSGFWKSDHQNSPKKKKNWESKIMQLIWFFKKIITIFFFLPAMDLIWSRTNEHHWVLFQLRSVRKNSHLIDMMTLFCVAKSGGARHSLRFYYFGPHQAKYYQSQRFVWPYSHNLSYLTINPKVLGENILLKWGENYQNRILDPGAPPKMGTKMQSHRDLLCLIATFDFKFK